MTLEEIYNIICFSNMSCAECRLYYDGICCYNSFDSIDKDALKDLLDDWHIKYTLKTPQENAGG